MDAATFFNDYMHPNIPVTVGNAITKEWPAIKYWLCQGKNDEGFCFLAAPSLQPL
jgi:hypothetical protein